MMFLLLTAIITAFLYRPIRWFVNEFINAPDEHELWPHGADEPLADALERVQPCAYLTDPATGRCVRCGLGWTAHDLAAPYVRVHPLPGSNLDTCQRIMAATELDEVRRRRHPSSRPDQ